MADSIFKETVPVRRYKRPSSAISPCKTAQDPVQPETKTPSRKRPMKKARFSDSALLSNSSVPGTTGLTPWVGKTSIKTPRRRVSTPAPTRHRDYEEIQFTPIREQLEPRTIRRIRRHGLSEEMNRCHEEQKSLAELQRQLDLKEEEVQRLKVELDKAKNATTDTISSQERVAEAEAELAQLRQSFSVNAEPISWDHVPTGAGLGPASDGGDTFRIYEDENPDHINGNSISMPDNEDAIAMGLELESARQAKEALFRASQTSFTNNIHFADSPVRAASTNLNIPPTPNTFYHDLSKQLKAAVSRAEGAEVALQAMNLEVQSLGFGLVDDDASTCISNVKDQFRQMRLELERAVPGETVGSFDNATLLPEIASKLKLVARRLQDREAELKSMRNQQRTLKGNFDHAIVAAEKANLRVKELEDTIDKNAEEMLEIRMRAQAVAREAEEHASNNRSLITAIEKYREEVTRLEQLVELIESEQAARLQDVRTATLEELSQKISDIDAKAASETRGRRAAEESAVDRLRKINELESALSTARQHSEDVKQQLKLLEKQLVTSKGSHEQEVGGLNSRISGLSTALSSANAEVEKLKKINGKLEERYKNEVEQGAQTLERIQNEYIRSVAKINEERKSHIRSSKVRYANWNLLSDELTSDDVAPMTPASLVRFVDPDHSEDHIQGSVEMSRGKKSRRSSGHCLGIRKRGRRRYDSGIGMDSLSEAEDSMASDPITPDLNSEAEIETDTGMDTAVRMTG
ncbi:uncharacterized protein A1O9_00346 [Exophiala aquamarina CBS 119918]|uniref:Uncharacterized protein n=1 Tax=Exophiala aquamarina CBS 119918 TaxID=1182545 RepID=A0A072PQK2_9EURO|nr:uncharacterized protein A1O9_00346 [Exophiala aquamarina CBS 119918]KEF62374.1 hypothetical protein A1O9_00346 [Exophiala aquamarina CBS 119918]